MCVLDYFQEEVGAPVLTAHHKDNLCGYRARFGARENVFDLTQSPTTHFAERRLASSRHAILPFIFDSGTPSLVGS